MIHKDICIQFKLGDQDFEAVGFLEKDERSILGQEVLKRVDNGLIVGKEDWDYIFEHKDELPSDLNDYCLVTKLSYPGNPRHVSVLGRDGRGWCEGWSGLGYDWLRDALVLRRRTLDIKTSDIQSNCSRI